MTSPITLDDLRRYAVTNTLFAPTTLKRAITKLGFVQADPIRAPARAQDLTLRHRVKNYRAGDLEAKYPKLDIEEDFFINHGFVPRAIHQLMHPRVYASGHAALVKKHGATLIEFVTKQGVVHPRDVDAHFAHGSMTNAWGGTSSVSTQLLDGMHYRGLLRIAGREKGIRLYALPVLTHSPRTTAEIDTALDQLLDVAINKYAPILAKSISALLGRVRLGAPQWHKRLPAAIARAKSRMATVTIDGVTWYWPAHADTSAEVDDQLRLLAPFDPIVWDRRRFEMLWGWAYRFEAYTPAAKRKLGYYALPMLWRDQVIGWANVSAQPTLTFDFGYVAGVPPKDRAFKRALADEQMRMSSFLRD
jgi:uncharacterized protein